MKKITYVNELPNPELSELKKQLVGHDFYYSDFKEFSEQQITMVEETLLLTTFYILRDENNKPITIVNNRTTKETDFVVVELNNGLINFYEDVNWMTTNDTMNSKNELVISMWWSGEQSVKEYIPLKDIKDFYYIKDPNHIKQ